MYRLFVRSYRKVAFIWKRAKAKRHIGEKNDRIPLCNWRLFFFPPSNGTGFLARVSRAGQRAEIVIYLQRSIRQMRLSYVSRVRDFNILALRCIEMAGKGGEKPITKNKKFVGTAHSSILQKF